jgi:hypothetical protein
MKANEKADQNPEKQSKLWLWGEDTQGKQNSKEKNNRKKKQGMDQ